MVWRIEFEAAAEKEFARLDRQAQRDILVFLRQRVARREDPRDMGGPLRGSLMGLWKYRVGDYRIVADIQPERLLVLVVRVGHRRKVYGGH